MTPPAKGATVRGPEEAKMSYSISWLMVNGKDRQSLLRELGLEATGKSGEFFDFKISGHALPNGSYLLVTQKCDHPFVSDKHLAQLSVGSKTLSCSIEEHVMYAHATCWDNGKNLWSVKHQGDTAEGRNDLTVSGAPPDSFKAIRDEYAAKQPGDPDVDWYFEIPLALAKQLAGFKHDETNPGLDGSFEELRDREGKSVTGKQWWKFWASD
jgi:hypothetical protein